MCRYHLPETRNNSRRFVVSYTHCQVSVARWRRRAAPPRTGTAPESTGELRTGSKIRNYHYQWQTGSTAVQATSPHAFLSLPFPVCLPHVASRTASPVPPPPTFRCLLELNPRPRRGSSWPPASPSPSPPFNSPASPHIPTPGTASAARSRRRPRAASSNPRRSARLPSSPGNDGARAVARP
jgi:hypothetical protein